MTIAIITARGGSRRLPRKNIKPFCGHPLVAWSIINAKCSINVDEVFVSTDDDEIEEISKNYGASVIRRPNWPDANEAAANRPFCHAIRTLKKEYGDDFDTMIGILPTTPLNKPGDFDNAFDLFKKWGADLILPLRPLREVLLYKKINDMKSRVKIFAKKYEYLGEAGGWSVTTPNNYLAINEVIESDLDSVLDKVDLTDAPQNYFLPMEYWQYADVDTLEEFEFAELLMERYILKGRGTDVYYDYINKKQEESKSNISIAFGNQNQLGLGEL